MVLGHAVVEENTIDLAVHEDVDELVPDHVAKIPHRPVVGDHDATLEKLEEPADSFGDKSGGGIGLLKVQMRAVKDERDAVGDVVTELLLENPVAFLCEKCPPLGKIPHLRIVIDVEVLGLEHVPVEIGVLDLILSEVEKLRESRANAGKRKDQIV